MTADEYRNAPLPANRAPELRIAWRCDAQGYVTTVYLLGAATEGEPAFIDVVRQYRGGSVLAPDEIVMDGWPTDEHGRGLTVLEVEALGSTYDLPTKEAA